MHPLLNIATRAARAAGNIIERHSQGLESLNIEQKKPNDFVSQVDKLAEQEIIEHIHKAYPEHAILAEESGVLNDKGADTTWIIDPLDGTTNYLHGYPQYAVSIACKIKNRLEVGLVYNPRTDELFTASRGAGATLNNKRLRVANRNSLDGALIGVGIPFSMERDFDEYLRQLRQFMGKPAGIRRGGASALDMAFVAAGRLDGYWEECLKPWDIAAGILLVQEAGGLVGNFSGGDDYLQTGEVVAANPKVYQAILQALAQVPRAK